MPMFGGAGRNGAKLKCTEAWNFESRKDFKGFLLLLSSAKTASRVLLGHGSKHKLWKLTRFEFCALGKFPNLSVPEFSHL